MTIDVTSRVVAGSYDFTIKQVIERLYLLGTTMVSDDAYGSGWDGITTAAPSKNAVYDMTHKQIMIREGFGGF